MIQRPLAPVRQPSSLRPHRSPALTRTTEAPKHRTPPRVRGNSARDEALATKQLAGEKVDNPDDY